ncbi:ABC transporter ATP-binding protein [Archaeoglobus neptunius]|uniref:ABC transporter ATP-binding protein n=1 Tax=Archaeoglobus neptunius TaxID=2798580 RepID=UPI0019295F7B|nr:ABC transporter ATP-binding protein [Archaeoglobus neptunius]
MKNDIILKTQNLSKFFDGLKALNRVNINVKRGSITLVIGPNGSGKTTFINTVSGFYRADEGRVFFEDREITNKPPHEISKFGIARTFQIPQPLKKMTVLENLLIAPDDYGVGVLNSIMGRWIKDEEEIVEKAFKILEFLKIDHLWDSEAQNLSGGQLKLLEVGRALMRDVKLIIMDEPIAGVNPVLSHSMLDRFVELKKMGMSFLIVEHRLDIVLKYTDHIYVMANGSVIAEGKEEDILNNPKVVEVYLGASDSEIECGI